MGMADSPLPDSPSCLADLVQVAVPCRALVGTTSNLHTVAEVDLIIPVYNEGPNIILRTW